MNDNLPNITLVALHQVLGLRTYMMHAGSILESLSLVNRTSKECKEEDYSLRLVHTSCAFLSLSLRIGHTQECCSSGPLGISKTPVRRHTG